MWSQNALTVAATIPFRRLSKPSPLSRHQRGECIHLQRSASGVLTRHFVRKLHPPDPLKAVRTSKSIEKKSEIFLRLWEAIEFVLCPIDRPAAFLDYL